ncbi:MAG: hypothetical protein Q7O66_16760 [Dehalococcoidia bacterium]|nr:hypothetical protein [Dehalococcoidia bacterium]
MAERITVEYTSRAFGPMDTIRGWEPWGTAKTPRGLLRVWKAAWGWTHPQQNAYGGHVRLTRDGNPITGRHALRLLGDARPDEERYYHLMWSTSEAEREAANA